MKNNKTILAIAALAIMGSSLIVGCSKKDIGVGGSYKGAISGTAYYRSYYTGDTTLLLMAGQRIQLKYLKDTANDAYAFFDTTDASGNFFFTDVDTTQPYALYAEAYINSSTSFTAPYYALLRGISAHSYSTPKPVLIATVDDGTHLNGDAGHYINVTTIDTTGSPIGNVKVLLYTSPMSANADVNLTGTGSIGSVTTDNYGKGLAAIGSISAGSVYTRSGTTIGATTYISVDTISITGKYTPRNIKVK